MDHPLSTDTDTNTALIWTGNRWMLLRITRESKINIWGNSVYFPAPHDPLPEGDNRAPRFTAYEIRYARTEVCRRGVTLPQFQQLLALDEAHQSERYALRDRHDNEQLALIDSFSLIGKVA